MPIKLFIKLILLTLFSLKLYAHDPKNCDVLQNYDFSGFESWKIEVVNRSNEFGLDEDFVSKLMPCLIFSMFCFYFRMSWPLSLIHI